MLTPEELEWFNEYHAMVYDRLSPYLNEDEKAWLKDATSPLTR
jgi:Xaa-Pro aminopeptidase